MKKLIMTAAVVACAGIVSAQVYSDNIVGYSATATPAAGGFDIISLGLFGPGDSVSIQDAISNLDELNSGTSFANVDKLYVWNGSTYVKYGLYDKGAGNIFWLVDGIGWNIPTFANPTSAVLDLGKGFWYESVDGAKTLTFSQNY